MSQVLQRVAVLMHFSPSVVEAVHAGRFPARLTAAEQAMLLAVDRRAWGTDGERQARALDALVPEFPASAAIAAQGGARIEVLHGFFSSRSFERAVLGRGSMPLAFGEWVLEHAGGVGLIEQGFARSKRAGPVEGLGVCTRPGVVPLSVPAGTLARWSWLRERLQPHPVAALTTGVDLSGMPALADDEEHLLIEPGEDGTSISSASRGLVKLLAACQSPLPKERVEALVVDLGGDADSARVIVHRQLREGLLVHR